MARFVLSGLALVVLLPMNTQAKPKTIAIAVGRFACAGDEVDSSKVKLLPVQDGTILEKLGDCDKPACWKKLVKKLRSDVVLYGAVSVEGQHNVAKVMWLDPRLAEPTVLLASKLVANGDFAPCKHLADWLPYLKRSHACHQSKCDPRSCVRHVYDDLSFFGSEPVWKTTSLEEDGLCVPKNALEEVCDPVSCDCLRANEEKLPVLGTFQGCTTRKRQVHLQLKRP
ncbi:hypothetical protein ACFL6C_07360 [Myxococcota bacterium]